MMKKFSQWMQTMHKQSAAVSLVQLVLLAKQHTSGPSTRLQGYRLLPTLKKDAVKGSDRL